MALLWYLCLLAALYSFLLSASSVSGKCNSIADSLSCFQFQRFYQLAPHADPDPTAAAFGFKPTLTDKCHFYLTHGLAPSIGKVYSSAQRCFQEFCTQDNRLSPSGSVLSASEETFICFCSHTAHTIHHLSMKAYISAIQSLHIDKGLPDPLVGCLQLQCVLPSIKHHQSSNQATLDFSIHSHTMRWAACCLQLPMSR